MCIGVCIDLFFDINLFNKINLLILFIDSYYRTISHFSLVYRNQRKVRILRFLARVLSPVINWTHRNQVTVGGISGGILCSV